MPGGIRQVSEFFLDELHYGPDGLGVEQRVVTRKSLSQAHNRTTKTSSAGCGSVFPKRLTGRHVSGLDAMRSAEEHRRVVAGLIRPRPPALAHAAGRHASGWCSPRTWWRRQSLPGFDNSWAMDGYAVVAEDIAGASAEQPVLLPVAGGTSPRRPYRICWTLKPGTAHRIMTGAPVPSGATAVVPVEATDFGATDTVSIRATAKTGQHIRRAGEWTSPRAPPCCGPGRSSQRLLRRPRRGTGIPGELPL